MKNKAKAVYYKDNDSINTIEDKSVSIRRKLRLSITNHLTIIFAQVVEK